VCLPFSLSYKDKDKATHTNCVKQSFKYFVLYFGVVVSFSCRQSKVKDFSPAVWLVSCSLYSALRFTVRCFSTVGNFRTCFVLRNYSGFGRVICLLSLSVTYSFHLSFCN